MRNSACGTPADTSLIEDFLVVLGTFGYGNMMLMRWELEYYKFVYVAPYPDVIELFFQIYMEHSY